jgi:hypothetical protein
LFRRWLWWVGLCREGKGGEVFVNLLEVVEQLTVSLQFYQQVLCTQLLIQATP